MEDSIKFSLSSRSQPPLHLSAFIIWRTWYIAEQLLQACVLRIQPHNTFCVGRLWNDLLKWPVPNMKVFNLLVLTYNSISNEVRSLLSHILMTLFDLLLYVLRSLYLNYLNAIRATHFNDLFLCLESVGGVQCFLHDPQTGVELRWNAAAINALTHLQMQRPVLSLVLLARIWLSSPTSVLSWNCCVCHWLRFWHPALNITSMLLSAAALLLLEAS